VRVWVYPEKVYEELGAERWKASWEQVKVSAERRNRMTEMNMKRKHERLGHAGSLVDCKLEGCCEYWRYSDIDPDSDLDHLAKIFRGPDAKEKALAYARKVVDSHKTAFGCVSVTRQVVDWYVEEDRVAEWQNTSDEETVD
jgi:hypothetical protein